MKRLLILAGALLTSASCSIDDRQTTLDGAETPERDAGGGGSTAADAGGMVECSGCRIAGACVGAGASEAGNPCRVCDPTRDAAGWSAADAECDDGLFCTMNDRCLAGRCTGGGDTPCDDGVACNGVSTCDEVNDRCTPPENQCGSGQLCDSSSGACVSACADCTIDGVCVEAGVTLAGNPCLICDPGRNTVGYSANPTASCGSGPTECSGQDTCDELGQCVSNDLADGAPCGAPGSDLACIAGQCTGCSAAPSPDAFCAARSSSTPFCDPGSGACVACLPSSCGGASPVCDPSVGCRACSEHSECPESACHLSGSSIGRCFSPGEVVQVTSVDALRTQVGILVPQAPRVLRLAPVTFAFDDLLEVGSAGTELVLLGQPGTVLTGGPTNGVPPMLSLAFDATLYVAGLTIADGPINAISTSSGSILWLDDVEIRDYGNIGLSGAGEGHVRRCRIRAASAAVRWQAGSLFMENTSLGPGAAIGLQTAGSPILDVRYVTIAGNVGSLACDASPGPSGFIRNSILTGTADPAIAGSACSLLTFAGNAVDQSGFGALIEHFDPTWFSGAANGDFHLTASGASAIGQTASFGAGDPPLDIDGTARPSPGAPGVDQP